MNRERTNRLGFAVVLAALVGAALLAVPGSPLYRHPTLGLDLRGGTEVVLKAIPPRGQKVATDQMQTAQSIIEHRVDNIGLSSPNVAIQGNNEIVVQIAGVRDSARAAAIIGKTGQLQFFDFETDLAAPTVSQLTPTPYPTAYSLLKQVQGEAKRAGPPSAYYLFGPKTVSKTVMGETTKTTIRHAILQGPVNTHKQLLDPYAGHKPADTEILAVPANRELVRGPIMTPATRPAQTSPNGRYWYLFKYAPTRPNGPPEINGKELNESGIGADIGQDGKPEVLLSFKSHGAAEFQTITAHEYRRGQRVAGLNSSANTLNQAYAQHNAIVLDGALKATPYIDYTNSSFSEGIVGGGATISDMGTMKQANDLKFVLQSGSLPYSFKQIARNDVSPTLGKSSLHQAVLAAIAGLVIVAIFLLVLYRFLGLVAVAGLAIYALLYYAAILLLNVTLTLPGFAGLILTIGVAADANVVVFERIKEEVRAGRSVRAAIAAGYGKGFHTILDANVVTAITALVLFLIALADVKGFALMLLIGTAISLLTAVVATRGMLGLLSGFQWFNNPRLMGAEGQQTAKWLQIDFIGKRRLWFALSGAVVFAGLAALGAHGLNLGIDFKGGTQSTFKTHKPYAQERVQAFLTQQGQPDAVVQGQGPARNGAYTLWQVRTKPLSSSEISNLSAAFKTDLGAYSTGVKSVSGTFGHQIAIDAIYGIVVSLLLIVAYITIRFDLKFAIPVILAMLHDIAVTVGVYALVGKEVTVDTVAAVLTVLGYSIYDTIIIFDRIRENAPLMRRSPFATIANISLWETIRRSLATTFITLLPIICLYVLGGATLKDFAFALIVGVTSGAYSSIFIAAPLLTMLKEREPEYARRKWQTLDPGAAGLKQSEADLAAEPTTIPARREKRRERRRSKLHGRPRQ